MSQSTFLEQIILLHFELLSHLHTDYSEKYLLTKVLMKIIINKSSVLSLRAIIL